jgi:hypothetical protein
MQKMREPTLTRHPDTEEPVRRILSRTFVGSGQSDFDGGDASTSGASGACSIPSPGDCPGGPCGWDSSDRAASLAACPGLADRGFLVMLGR